jgi:3-oxoacyl-[acyl-carrier protein] reductase
MADLYAQLVNSPVGSPLTSALGLPKPTELRRHTPGQALVEGAVYVGGAPGGRLVGPALKALHDAGAHVTDAPLPEEGTRYGALVFDATGITDSTQLRAVYEFFHPVIRSLRSSGRVLVLATPPGACGSARERAAQRALEGFVRALAKELRGGSTAQLLSVAPGGEEGLVAPLRFLLSAKSAFVSAQQIVVAPVEGADPQPPVDWERPLDGKVALVTGAARGIGAAIAEVLARDGAHVVCLDIPAQGEQLSGVANGIGGSALQVDITAEDAPQVIADHLRERHGGVDVFVHNAGVTRDKTLAGMDEARWELVLDINLSAEERINDALLDGVLNPGGRIVCVSSLSGIAGNRGQTNYAASKAGVIGMVSAIAEEVDEGRTINAVAPGFIETEMTGAMPFAVREVGRRFNSLNQGGQPVDVAETIAFFANPGSAWVNGNIVRVCGQNLLGA